MQVSTQSEIGLENDVIKWQSFFIYSAGAILLTTGLAKILSVFGKQEMLDLIDPVFGFSFRKLLVFAAFLELAISAVCFLLPNRSLRIGLIAWLGTILMMYRVGLSASGWQRPCPCVGNITDAIHLSGRSADLFSRAFLIYLLIGSYGLLFFKFSKRLK
jgi:hypothetical protein